MAASVSSSSREMITDLFDAFRAELDEYTDRQEALVKVSRDITRASKKCIFLLHRLVLDPSVASSEESDGLKSAAQKGFTALSEIKPLFEKISGEVKGETRYWRHQKEISHGLQEFIEALGFAYWLEHSTLITYSDVQEYLSYSSGEPYFPLPHSDYLLGLSDLTGELMRFAISAIATRGGRKRAREVVTFVRECRAGFEPFTPTVRGLADKQNVTTQSLKKIEDAAYAIVLREREYSASPDVLEDLVQRYIVGMGADRGYEGPPRSGKEDAMERDYGDED